MRATLTEEQEQLAATAAELAGSGLAAARGTLSGEDLPAEPTRSLTEGFGGLAVSEERGGLGGDLVDLALVIEGLGRTVTPTPWVAHCLAVQVAAAAGIDVAAALRDGVMWTLAVPAEGVSADDRAVEGTVPAVREGEAADAAVLVVSDGVAVAIPDQREPRRPFDTTRPLADLRFNGSAPTAHVTADPEAVQRPAITALAAELVGVGRGAIDLAVRHATSREQFGQPVGRFQAVAHQLAEAWTGIENAWSLTLYAAWAVSAEDDEAPAAVHAAKARAGEAAVHAAERGTQVHGGIGITWEADPHLFLRRALADDQWLGSARQHRRWLGAALLGQVVTQAGGRS